MAIPNHKEANNGGASSAGNGRGALRLVVDGPGATGPAPRATAAFQVAVLLGLFALATLLHVASGAFESGFGGFEDEPAHLVTSLMVRDWLASGDLSNPRAFAENYYVHYPKVGVGQWPPLFHGLLGVWMLVIGTSTASVVAFMTLIEALIAFVIYSVLRRPLGDAAGVLAGGLFLTVPIVQECSASAMTESLIALLGLGAVLAFGRFLDTGKARWVFAFAGAAGATLLTKGSGLALGLVPPLSILFLRRLDLLLRPALWGAAVMVALIVGPWYYFTLSMSQGTWTGGGSPSWEFFVSAALAFPGWLPGLAGWLGLLLVPVGLFWGLRNGASHGRWVALAAWVPAILILHLTVPSSIEERHFAVLAPAWTIFAALGAGVVGATLFEGLGGGSGGRAQKLAPAGGVLVMAAAMFVTHGRLATKHWSGWGEAARRVAVRGDQSPDRLLIASDPVGEGLFVAGVALAEDRRPLRLVMRASKVLGNAGWSGYDYEQRFATLDEVDGYLREHGVGYVAVDESTRSSRHWYPHMEQLLGVLESQDRGWRPFASDDVVRDGIVYPGSLRAFVREDWKALPRPEISLSDVLRR